MVVVIPGIGPEQDGVGSAPGGVRGRFGLPSLEAAWRKLRETTLGGDSKDSFDGVAEAGELQRKVGEARRETGDC